MLFFCETVRAQRQYYGGADIELEKSLFTIAAIQVGTGVSIIGVLSFIPLFLVEIGGQRSRGGGFLGRTYFRVTPMMVSFSAPYWTRKAEQYGGRRILALILALITAVAFSCSLATKPWHLFVLRMIQGLIGVLSRYVPL